MRIKILQPLPFFLLTSILFVTFVLLTPSVFALGKPVEVGEKPSVASEPGKLRACQAKENGIKNRLTSLNNLATNMESKFTSIANRVEEYYTAKVVPAGKTVPNYDALVSDIQTKKTAVQTALTKTQTDAGTFTCTSNDPKGQLTLFRKDMQAVKSALKEYRTSIKNLTVAVHSAK